MPEKCQGNAQKFAGSCARKPTVVHDGKPYCWQHDPVRMRRKAAESWAKRKAEMARIEAEQDARIARRKLVEAAGLSDLTDDELRAIAARGGIRAMLK